MPKISSNIRDYVDLSQGNWWKYKVPGQSSLLEVKVEGYRNIDGKNVPALKQSNGITAYQGYDGNEFKTYGLEFAGNFIKFTNPIVVGDSSLELNKNYTTTTGISGIPGYSETHSYTYEKLKVLAAKKDLSYRCWQAKVELRNSNGAYAYSNTWFAKGIGQIKIYDPNSGDIRLVEAYINGRHHTGFTDTLMAKTEGKSAEKILIGASLFNYKLP